MAVAVVIDPGRARAEFVWSPEAGLLCHISEGAVAIVVEQVILAERSDEDVVVAVVVVVADGNAHAEHFDGETCFARHVGECPVVIVVIEGERGVLAARGPENRCH